MLYGACFLAAGAVLLAITYGLVEQELPAQQTLLIRGHSTPTPSNFAVVARRVSGAGKLRTPLVSGVPPGLRIAAIDLQRQAQLQLTAARTTQRATLLTESGIALAIMALVSIALGWLLAGRALAPLRTMNARARQITERSLHERLAVKARDDELGDLARTFDDLLARLQRAFESQRRFVANASHELRTPITLERALVEVALADPAASVGSLRDCCRRVLAAGEQQERLIEALLTLARSQGVLDARERIDLGRVVGELVAQRRAELSVPELRCALTPAVMLGDRALVERLVANLLDNAVAYNLAAGGWVELRTDMRDGRSVLHVANSGNPVPAERVEEMFEPFRRLDGDRINGGQGLGLGLSIVSAIAASHGAELRCAPLAAGGLEIEVGFPVVPGNGQ